MTEITINKSTGSTVIKFDEELDNEVITKLIQLIKKIVEKEKRKKA